MTTPLAPRFTALHPLSPFLTLVRDQDGTPRVLKRMNPLFADDPEAVLRFRLEAWRASRLSGPRFARAYGDDPAAADAEAPYYTMGYAQGPAATLVSPHELPEVLRQLAAALVELHRHGWVHAGLEPAQLRRTDGGLVVVGYGSLTPIGQPASRPGHPDFQAPEQAMGLPLDGRADLYGVGALLHYWLTNRAYDGQDRLSGIESPFAPLTRRLLAERPEDRPASAAALLAELGLVVEAAPPVWAPGVVARPEAIQPAIALLDALEGGTGASRRLEAPPGAGKSVYLAQVAEAARARGFAVIEAAGRDRLGAPLAPFEPLVGGLLALAEGQPGLADRLKARLQNFLDAPPSPGLDVEGMRLRWLTSLAEGLQAVAEPGLVVLLDDWDQADEASQAAQEFLRRRLLDAPVVWLAAGQRLPSRSPALPLAPFGRNELFALAARLVPGPMAGPDVEALAVSAQGSPWRLIHLVAHLREAGALRREGPQWTLTLGPETPESPEALAWARANTLGPAAWSVAALLALRAPEIEAWELRALLPDAALAEGLDALMRAGAVAPGPLGWRFTHPAFEAAFADAPLPAPAPELLATLVDALDVAALGAREATRWVTPALEADRPAVAAALALKAGRGALAAGGATQARVLLEDGMITLDTEHPDRARFVAALAETYRVERRLPEARGLLEEALQAATAGPDRLDALQALGRLALAAGQPEAALPRFREAVAIAQRGGRADAVALALSGLTEALAGSSDAESALVSGEAALGAATEASPLPRAAALQALGAVLATGARERQLEGVALLQRAVAIHETEADPVGLLGALLRLADAERARGELRIACETAERALAVAEGLDDARAATSAALALSDAERELGDAAAAADHAHAARERARPLGATALVVEALVQEGLARQALGEVEAAWKLLDEAEGAVESGAAAPLVASVLLARAEVAFAQGRLPEAAGALARAERSVAATHRPELVARRSYWLGRWAGRSGDRDRARHELKSVLASPNGYWVARAALALGELAAEANARAEASGWLEQARRGAVTLGVDWLATAANEAEKALTAPAPAETFEAAAARLGALFTEASHLLPLLVAPADELTTLRRRLVEAEAMRELWKRMFSVEDATGVAEALAEALFAASCAERVFVLGRAFEPLASRSREAGALPYSPSLVRLDLCRAALEQGRTILSEPDVAAFAAPLGGPDRPRWVLYAVGLPEVPAVWGAIAEAAETAIRQLES